jgi:hypothetical protein
MNDTSEQETSVASGSTGVNKPYLFAAPLHHHRTSIRPKNFRSTACDSTVEAFQTVDFFFLAFGRVLVPHLFEFLKFLSFTELFVTVARVRKDTRYSAI